MEVLLIVAAIIFGVASEIKKSAKHHKELKEKGITRDAKLKHVSGLPISEDTICTINSYPDKYEFIADGLNFNLPRERITNLCVKKHDDITAQKVSSIGGAVAGGVLFGPLGAIIGGRAKTHKVNNKTHYLVFTYLKDEEVKYICFEAPGLEKAQADWLVIDYNKTAQKTGETKQIDL